MPDFKPGQTVQLTDGRRGTVRFAGQTNFQVGEWVGIELDEKTGKNNGSVKGERYFDCRDGYGMFVKPVMATIIAQPPAPKAAARKPARPSSFNPGAGRTSTGVDAASTKRRSLNAPSPSPGPKPSRPSSIARVSTPGTASRWDWRKLTYDFVVVSYQTTGWPCECVELSNRHAIERPGIFHWYGCDQADTPCCWNSNLNGTPCSACFSDG